MTLQDRIVLPLSMLAAALLWLFISLSQTYTTEVSIPVVFTNLPDDKALLQPLPNKMDMFVRSQGAYLVWYFTLKNMRLQIDYRQQPASRSIPAINYLRTLQQQMPRIEITDIKPDTIYFKFDKKSEKLAPVKIRYNITTNPAFDLKTVAANPDTILVVGPASVVDTIKYWQTEQITYRDIKQTYEGVIALTKPPMPTLTISANAVKYKVTVEEFTEKTLSIPIEKLNVPPRASVFIYPQNANVIFQVGISEFDQIEPYYFKIAADFNGINLQTDKGVPLKLIEKPINVRNIRISPKMAEFMIMGNTAK